MPARNACGPTCRRARRSGSLALLLPGVDGIALMERIDELAELPVVFISAWDRDETVAKAPDAGAAD